MLTITCSAITSIQSCNEILAVAREKSNAESLLDSMQNIINQPAALSRFFWPIKSDDQTQARGAYLRSVFSINDNSVLKSREIRNAIEHFDERLDKFTSKTIAGNIYPNYVGNTPQQGSVPFFTFRAFYYDTNYFEVLGEKIALKDVYLEIEHVHNKLVEFNENGGRLKSK